MELQAIRLAHSLSPIIMNTALRRENVNAVYLALHAKTLKDLLACVRDIPIHGLSITMPYKEAILEHLDNTDSHTTKIGACNTVVRAQDGKLYGFNTDTAGVVRPLGAAHWRSKARGCWFWALGARRARRSSDSKSVGSEVFILNRSAGPCAETGTAEHGRAPSSALDLKKLSV